MLVQVALPLPVHRRFTYEAPEMPPRGARVVVGFGRRRMVGFAAGPAGTAPAGARIRPIEQVLDSQPVLSDSEWSLAEWMARYYVAPLGTVLRLFFPPGATYSVREGEAGAAAAPEERLHVLPVAEAGEERAALVLEALARAPAQRRAWEAARALEAPVERAAFCEAAGVSAAAVRALTERGFLQVESRPVLRDPHAGGAHLPAVGPEGSLTDAQQGAVRAVRDALAEPRGGRVVVVEGITGSGKTRVYVEAAAAVVEAGGRAIVLVPEIGLAGPATSRFRARFGERVAVLHSALSDGERFDAWGRIRSGAAPVVIGARSALFAPVGRAALIVVDEEHDTAYKQDETPRYLARDVAVYRAALENGVVVLGSATPSLETRANVEARKYRSATLPARIGGRALPEVEIVDLRADRVEAETLASNGEAEAPEPDDGGGPPPRGSSGADGSGAAAGVRLTPSAIVAPGLSARLVESLETALAAGDQALLFLNRRGFASFLQCTDCGWVADCPNCRISLTYHRGRPRLLCHYCAHAEPVPDSCPACSGRRLDHRGLGTQQVEAALQGRFPEARVARMDLDTTAAKWAHSRLYRAMQAREIDFLVGTQMIAKGFDLPGVALVGVVSADTGLHLPDFRASERTFQLLVQVAGRAGRGERPGKVLVQTYLPGHPAVRAAATHDVEGFYREEIGIRRELGYPPAARLANVVVSGAREEAAAEGVERVAEHLRGRAAAGLSIVGPAPCPLERLRGRSRHHVLLKAESPAPLDRALWDLAANEERLAGRGARLEIDRDPLSLL